MASGTGEERVLEIWESMFGNNVNANAHEYIVDYKTFLKLVTQYGDTREREGRFDELDLIPVIEAKGVGYETIVNHRKERYRLLYEGAKQPKRKEEA